MERRAALNRGTKRLAPGKPLERRTALNGGKPLARKTAPKARPRTPSTRPKPRHTGPSTATAAIVVSRDHGRCVRCGKPANNKDHRRTRGTGGTHGEASDVINQPAWLLTLCGQGNTSGCHGWKDDEPEQAEREGFRFRLNGPLVDAEKVPVRTWRSRTGWATFDNQGNVHECPPPPDDDASNAWQPLNL